MTADKVVTLLGFAMRANKVVLGTDAIERWRKKKYLLLICHTLGENSRKKLLSLSAGIPAALVTEGTLGERVHREGVKALLVTDKQLADAILNNMNGSYRTITEVK